MGGAERDQQGAGEAGGAVLLLIRQHGNARVVGEAVKEIGMRPVPIGAESDLAPALGDHSDIRCALVDVAGFGQSVWQMCKDLQAREVPFVVLSTARDRELGNRTLGLGAASVVEKPIAKSALLQLLNNIGK